VNLHPPSPEPYRRIHDPLVPAALLTRKGSPTTAGVPMKVLRWLNEGRLETVNLAEWLVVDQAYLADRVFDSFGWSSLREPLRLALASLPSPTTPRRLKAVGQVLAHGFPEPDAFQVAYSCLAQHPSDLVRAWAAYLAGLHPSLDLAGRLAFLRPLAADPNLSVREIAWMALRPPLAAELESGLRLLEPWTRDRDPGVRRCASEVSRPRGVWCQHLTVLKDRPELGLPLLEALKSDDSKYVRDSVGNWLNDASKSRPDWVRTVCAEWRKSSPTPETAYVVKRGLRTLNAGNKKGPEGKTPGP
jgi:3-methyladenine DNA glycosylase AlkC